jgi:general secretion pathway protein C
VINPPQPQQADERGTVVDIDSLVAAQLFGATDEEALASAAAAAEQAQAMSEAEAREALAGIEDGAPETRLPLLLRGVVAASEAGLGQAVIEHRNTQDLYRVGDELPVSGRVLLAKVMGNQVVIDNGGRYELLRLFESSDALTAVPQRSAPPPEVRRERPAEPASSPQAASARDPAAIASAYRDRLYNDPQSLADVVTVTAVRSGDALLGYRLQPGRAAGEFAALGFRPGDLVTAVNGLDLSDPANTVRLYQAMRSAQVAVIDLERGGESLSLTVSLAGADRDS